MNIKQLFHHFIPKPKPTRSVALVLSGGGARGLAQIGAIEQLLNRGYTVHAVAGTSIGSLVGGFLCCGKLDVLKQKVLSLTRREVRQLIDFSIGLDHIATADNLLVLMRQLLGDARIEDLPVNYCCCASDLTSGCEKVFRSGLLADAIRASISIPGFFKPVRMGNEALVDGSLHNIFPLDRVMRSEDDLLVGINVSAPESKPCTDYIEHSDDSVGRLMSWIRSIIPGGQAQLSSNALNLMLRVVRITLQNNTQNAMRLTPPDLCVEVPMDAFGIFDFERGKEIIDYGAHVMNIQLDKYEAEVNRN